MNHTLLKELHERCEYFTKCIAELEKILKVSGTGCRVTFEKFVEKVQTYTESTTVRDDLVFYELVNVAIEHLNKNIFCLEAEIEEEMSEVVPAKKVRGCGGGMANPHDDGNLGNSSGEQQ